MPLHIHDIVTRLPSRGSNGQRRLRDIKGAVMHHAGVFADEKADTIERIKGWARFHVGKGWRRIGYTFVIGRDGTVYLVNRIEEISWHAGHFLTNTNHLGICLDGDLTKQAVTPKQKESMLALLDYLCRHRSDMPLLVDSTIRTHQEVRVGNTSCPGDEVTKIVNAFRSPVCKPLVVR